MKRKLEWALVVLFIACLCAYPRLEDIRVNELAQDLRQLMEQMGRGDESVKLQRSAAGRVSVTMNSPHSAGLVPLIEYLATRHHCRLGQMDYPQSSSLADRWAERFRDRAQRQLDQALGPQRSALVVVVKTHYAYRSTDTSIYSSDASVIEPSPVLVWLLLADPTPDTVIRSTATVLDSIGLHESMGDTLRLLRP